MNDSHHLPPFTKALLDFAKEARDDFCTPGHHSGALFDEIPEGRAFVSALGEGAFTADISDSSSVIGDPSSHEGVSGEAEALAASVYGSDRCFFVLGGTSASNRIAISALVSEGDLILFDRNNHKSASQAALAAAGGLPVYLASERNESGIIGGLTEETLDPVRLRKKAAMLSPAAGKKQRPYRLACLQLSTYDGLFLNASELLRRIGSLCDYILFDGAWAGYENFLPLLQDSAVLTFPLTKDDPGILVTQSVHKQLAGFSMTSQLHKKDSHLRGMTRYLEDDVLQAAFLMHISTSPYYPLLAGLEMNAYLHQKKGKELWQEADHGDRAEEIHPQALPLPSTIHCSHGARRFLGRPPGRRDPLRSRLLCDFPQRHLARLLPYRRKPLPHRSLQGAPRDRPAPCAASFPFSRKPTCDGGEI